MAPKLYDTGRNKLGYYMRMLQKHAPLLSGVYLDKCIAELRLRLEDVQRASTDVPQCPKSILESAMQREPETDHDTAHIFKTAAVLCPLPQQVTLVLYPFRTISLIASPESHIAGYRTSTAPCLPNEIAHLDPLYHSESILTPNHTKQRCTGRQAQGPQSHGRKNQHSRVKTSSCIEIKRRCDSDIPELLPSFCIHDKHNVCTIENDPHQHMAELLDFYPRDNVIPRFSIGNKRYAIFPLRVIVYSETELLSFHCDRLATELYTSLFDGALRYCPELYVSKIHDIEDAELFLDPWDPPKFEVLSIHCVGITVIMDYNDWNIPNTYRDALTSISHSAQKTLEEHLNMDESELVLQSMCTYHERIPELLQALPEFTPLEELIPQFANRKTMT